MGILRENNLWRTEWGILYPTIKYINRLVNNVTSYIKMLEKERVLIKTTIALLKGPEREENQDVNLGVFLQIKISLG